MGVSLAPSLNLRAFIPNELIEDRYLYMASAESRLGSCT